MEPVFVDDPQDAALAGLRRLREPDRVASAQGSVVVEGFTVIDQWLSQGRTLRQAVVTPRLWSRLQAGLERAQVPTVVVEPAVMNAAAGFDLHRGAVAWLDIPRQPPWSHVVATARTLLVVEGVNDAENLGALMRSAWALGVDAVVLDPTTIDPFGRRVVRVSMGAVLSVPIVRASTWPDALADLRRHGVTVLGLTPKVDAVAWQNLDISHDQRVAVLVGAEGPGLDEASLRLVDTLVRIPIRQQVDSLNVAHAAAIVLAALDRAPTITS